MNDALFPPGWKCPLGKCAGGWCFACRKAALSMEPGTVAAQQAAVLEKRVDDAVFAVLPGMVPKRTVDQTSCDHVFALGANDIAISCCLCKLRIQRNHLKVYVDAASRDRVNEFTKRNSELGDRCGTLAKERDDLLRENAVLRRQVESLERKGRR